MTLPTKMHQPVVEKYQIDPLVKILVNAQVPATLAVLPEDSCVVLDSQLPRLQPEWELALALAQYLGQIEGHGLVFDVQWLIRFNSKTVATVMVFINKPVGFSMTMDSLNQAVAAFMTLLVPQSDLMSSHSLPTSDGVVASAAVQAAEMYLERYGGRPVANQLMVETGGAQIACVKGSWPKSQAAEKVPQITMHLARYDGRRLSARKAFFRLEKGGLEVFYDEANFDHQFRVLGEDVSVLLEIEVEHRWIDRKESLHLKSFVEASNGKTDPMIN